MGETKSVGQGDIIRVGGGPTVDSRQGGDSGGGGGGDWMVVYVARSEEGGGHLVEVEESDQANGGGGGGGNVKGGKQWLPCVSPPQSPHHLKVTFIPDDSMENGGGALALNNHHNNNNTSSTNNHSSSQASISKITTLCVTPAPLSLLWTRPPPIYTTTPLSSVDYPTGQLNANIDLTGFESTHPLIALKGSDREIIRGVTVDLLFYYEEENAASGQGLPNNNNYNNDNNNNNNNINNNNNDNNNSSSSSSSNHNASKPLTPGLTFPSPGGYFLSCYFDPVALRQNHPTLGIPTTPSLISTLHSIIYPLTPPTIHPQCTAPWWGWLNWTLSQTHP